MRYRIKELIRQQKKSGLKGGKSIFGALIGVLWLRPTASVRSDLGDMRTWQSKIAVESQYCPLGSTPSIYCPNMLPVESQLRLMCEAAACASRQKRCSG